MEEQVYQPTEKQEQRWSEMKAPEIPTDDAIKEKWKKSHRGSERGWGMLKAQLMAQQHQYTREYQIGLWQGKLDKANKVDYCEKSGEKSYNLGYYRGYNETIWGYIRDAIRTNPNFKHLEGRYE